MMVYEVVNISTSLGITKVSDQFKELVLATYPGQNISKFTDEALRLIRIMECGYALPYQLGSDLIEKVHQTDSTYFNMQVQLLLHKTRTMENSVGPIADPKTLESHANYDNCGPIALCNTLQTLYSDLLKANSWPAVAPSLPESNNATALYSSPSAGSPKQRSSGSSTSDGPGPKADSNNTNQGVMLPPKIWKYIQPANEDQCIIVYDIKYFWCGKCVCKRTNKAGFYNHTHPTSKHQSKSPQNANRPSPAPNASADDNPPPAASNTDVDSANLSVAGDQASASVDPTSTLVDPDDFEFQGAFMHCHDEGSLWMTSIDDDDDDASFLDEPLPPPSLTPVPVADTTAASNEPEFLAAVQLAVAHLSLDAADDGFELENSFLQSRLEETTAVPPSVPPSAQPFFEVSPPPVTSPSPSSPNP